MLTENQGKVKRFGEEVLGVNVMDDEQMQCYNL
jgi:hypothetical protein